MKTTIEQQDHTLIFPILMIHKQDLNRPDPLIIRFFSLTEGIVVSHNSECENDFGEWECNSYDINHYIPFKGRIIIEQ